MLKRSLRSGYTTGACAAAAAKAATLVLFKESLSSVVVIPLPDSSRASFSIHESGIKDGGQTAWASVIKDAGDDPDVTNGAEIVAEARLLNDVVKQGNGETEGSAPFIIRGGRGVGIITKPGLPVDIGKPAINPVPRKMIGEAVMEAISETGGRSSYSLDSRGPLVEITISVPEGEALAKKTLNARLGITGGISILGTTGIVRPISSEAWTATISASMNVARALGYGSIVLSAGRASEKAHMKKYALPDESYVMMGDYLEFALLDAVRHGFSAIHLCAQWAKMLKIAMATPQTHVRHGAIAMKKATGFLRSIGIETPEGTEFNTAREIFDFINSALIDSRPSLLSDVCSVAKRYSESITSGLPVTAHLVSYEGDIIASSN
ncbi:MAG: cobalamin biosynthesis protein CbiD [Nitrospirae bacterium]|nr:cobalamin biosynthesis protein CbiD [Nitrospirota bacterium]